MSESIVRRKATIKANELSIKIDEVLREFGGHLQYDQKGNFLVSITSRADSDNEVTKTALIDNTPF